MARIEPYLLNLAGEYRVCSELNKRGVFASMTYGNRKSADVYAISQGTAIKIEVKTSQRNNFVTSITQKGLDKKSAANPDLWVLCQIKQERDGSYTERFFVLSHKEICKIQNKRNIAYAQKTGKPHDPAKGVDNVVLSDVEPYEGQWSKIVTMFERAAE